MKAMQQTKCQYCNVPANNFLLFLWVTDSCRLELKHPQISLRYTTISASAVTCLPTLQRHSSSWEETYYITRPKISSVKHFTILAESQDKLAWWGERLSGINLHQTNLQGTNSINSSDWQSNEQRRSSHSCSQLNHSRTWVLTDVFKYLKPANMTFSTYTSIKRFLVICRVRVFILFAIMSLRMLIC